MPNWCYNDVTVSARPQELLKLVQAFADGRLFDSIIPVPEALKDELLHSYGGFNADENDASRAEMMQVYGYENMIDFCYDKWGTKWDVCMYDDAARGGKWDVAVKDNGDLQLSFRTAWSPPFGIFEGMKDLGYYVVAKYTEEMDEYSGVWEDGNIIET
jgi:hypothetical protein